MRANNTYLSTDYTGSTPVAYDSGSYTTANGQITLIGTLSNNLLTTANYSINGSVMTLSGATSYGPYHIDVIEKLTKQ